MSEYFLRRIAYFVPVLFLVTVVTFSVALLLPGDPALAYIGEANMRDRVMYETMRKELGLDQPIPMQYAKWLGRVLRGGILSAVRPNSNADKVGTVLAMSGVAIPDFWLGIMLIYVFSVWFKVLPPSGYVPVSQGLGSSLQSMLLPAFSLQP